MVTAYTLAFGSLLPPGGRLADLLGRKVTFLTGLYGLPQNRPYPVVTGQQASLMAMAKIQDLLTGGGAAEE